MNAPGTPAKHVIITPVCRANRGDDGALQEAVERVRSEYDACLAGNPQANFHLILTVERPK